MTKISTTVLKFCAVVFLCGSLHAGQRPQLPHSGEARLKPVANHKLSSLGEDSIDFVRSWGTLLLKKDDPAFSNTDYLDTLKEAAAPSTVEYWVNPVYRNHKFDWLFEKLKGLLKKSLPHSSQAAFFRFTNSGTEANNALYEMAEKAFQERTGRKAKRVELLYFGQPYGGTFGRISEISNRYESDQEHQALYQVPTPHILTGQELTEEKLKEVMQLEDAAIEFIEKRSSDKDLEVGALFFEAVSATRQGIMMFRPEFMHRLRKKADELHIPLFVDEVLTGGGRTGKPWAFQHYGKGFEPDLLTFGKGLMAQGVVFFSREDQYGHWIYQFPVQGMPREINQYPHTVLDNTSRINPLVLTQAHAVWQRLLGDHLDRNAAVMGDKIINRLKEMFPDQKSKISGLGLLIHVSDLSGAATSQAVKHYQGRWTPPLTITETEIDTLLDVAATPAALNP